MLGDAARQSPDPHTHRQTHTESVDKGGFMIMLLKDPEPETNLLLTSCSLR